MVRENGTGREEGRKGGMEERTMAVEMAGVLQKFTRGPVHEHVNVEPGGVPVVTVPNVRHVCEFVYTRTCARDIRVQREDLGICPSRVSGHTVPYSEYPALKPTITLLGSRLSAIPPLRTEDI